MRILTIRGENLASLGQPFEIDFESGPLAGTGLFAITGETGSGKSTILDALCLALYGLYPRFSENQQQDALPDPSGARPSIMDGGTILRRGAGNGHAEVEFIGQDSQRYRARWEARRAHNKPNGTIQSAQRTLSRIEGSTVHQIARSKTEVQRAVDSLTGLSFEQFCRTVLLPQGQFDAFLMAQKAERGALLEKITGTEIYGRISKIVYEKTRSLKSEAEQLETRLTNLGVLPADERATIQQNIEILEQSVAARSAEQNALRDRISRLQNLERAHTRLTEAEAALEQARSNGALAGDDRAHLKALLLAEPLRPLRDRMTDLGRRQVPAEQEVTLAQGDLEQAIENDEQAKATVLTAQAAHEEAEQDFKNFGPIWDKATALDSQRATAESEANTARNAAADAHQALSRTEDDLSATTRQLREAEVELETSRAELEKRSEFSSLADQISTVELRFERYESGLNEATDLRGQVDAYQQTASGIGQSLADLNGRVATESEAQETASETARELEQKLDGADEGKWKTEESALETLHRQTRDLEILIGRNLRSARKRDEAQTARGEAVDAIEGASNRIAVAEATQLDLSRRRQEIQHNSELADASLEDRSAHLRSLLVNEEPCPVCGATEHPYTAGGTDDSLSKLAENLRRERSALDEQLKQSGQELQGATTTLTTAKGLARNADHDESQAAAEINTIAGDFSTLRGEMEAACAGFGFIGWLPEVLSNDDSPTLLAVQLNAAIEARQAIANDNLTVTKALRVQLDVVNRDNQQVQARLNAATKQRDEENNRLHETQLKNATASEGLAQAESRLSEIEQDLSPFIAVAGVSLEGLRENPSACFAILKSLAQEVIDFRARETESTARVSGLRDRHKEQTSTRGNLATRAQEAQENLNTRIEAHLSVSEARALLIDGEETKAHRTRINDRRLQTSERLQCAKGEVTRFAAERAGALQRQRSAVEALGRFQGDIATALVAYSERCASLEIEITIADGLLATPATQTDELKTRIEGIDTAIRDAEHTVNERRSVVQNLSSGEPETTDRATLDAELSQITEEVNRSHEEIGDQKGRLTQDESLRRTADELRKEADAKATVLATWHQVEDAIGSANGDRFRTFAQSITLEQLVQLANEHLANFSGRYQLARSADTELALHVIDSDMGEEHRSVRSLSGGERFLVSLSLALSLSGLEGHDFTVDTLFIDEGFGSLDADTLGVAITALETLHGRGRKVGVITHVEAMIDNIPVQLKVEKLGAGSSVVRLQSAGSVI